MSELDDIFASDEAVQEEEVVTEQPVTDEVEPEATEEPQEAEKPEEAKADEPENDSSEPVMVPKARLTQEINKRKKAEDQLKRMTPVEQQEQPKAPDMFLEPQKYQQYSEERAKQAAFDATANMSEMLARREHGDEVVDESVEIFKGLAAQNPALVQSMRQSRDPYQFVIDHAKKHKVVTEIGDDPDAYRANLRQQIEAEVRQSLMDEQRQQQAQTRTPSLASQPNLGPRNVSTPDIDVLDELFG